MHIGDDPFQTWTLKAAPRAIEAMVAPPLGSSPEAAEAFYGQAYLMVSFLESLCEQHAGPASARASSCAGPLLVSALLSGRATAETLFDWATAQWTSEPARAAWQVYAAKATRPN